MPHKILPESATAEEVFHELKASAASGDLLRLDDALQKWDSVDDLVHPQHVRESATVRAPNLWQDTGPAAGLECGGQTRAHRDRRLFTRPERMHRHPNGDQAGFSTQAVGCDATILRSRVEH